MVRSGARKDSKDANSCSKLERIENPHHSKYGVKSYLHYFYEDCSGIGICESDASVYESTDKQQRKRKWFVVYLLCLIGALIAITGLVLLLVGVALVDSSFITKSHGYDSRKDKILQDTRLAGASLFCVGGVMVAVCVVAIYLGKLELEKERLERRQFEQRLKRGLSLEQPIEARVNEPTSPRTSLSPDLPVSLYEVTPVQPLLEDAGLVETKDHVTAANQLTTTSTY